MRGWDHRIFTIDDLHRHANDLGLEVVTVDDSEAGQVRVTLTEMPESLVIRRPVGPERLDRLRRRLEQGGAVGIHWTVSLQTARGRTLPRMNASRAANIAMVVLGIVLLIAAIAGVIYGVTTHTEPGLDSRAVTWPRDRFPLAVCPEDYAGGDRSYALEMSARAMGAMNTRLGFDAFVASLHGSPCDIEVTIGVPSEPGWIEPGGDARLGHGPTCEVRTSNTGTDEILSYVLQHELGHCLGLAHDDWPGSIMRPIQTMTPDGEFPPWITDTDRELLRSLYGPPG